MRISRSPRQFRAIRFGLLVGGVLWGCVGWSPLHGTASWPKAAFGSHLTWSDEDWSGGRYTEARFVDPEIAPGHLVLENRLDDLRLVARPTAFQGMYSMAVLHDTLFITASNYPYMYDGAQVIAYDMTSGEFKVVYEPYESGLHLIKRFGDMLYLPGPDSMDPWYAEGSIYTYDGYTWEEKASLPTAVHVNDVELVNGRLYATTGQALGELNGFGCVWVSDDGGDTFQRVLCIEPNEAHVWRRIFGAGSLGDRLFVQPDGFPPEDEVLYSTRDGAVWDTIPVPGMPNDKMAMFTAWGDSLLMTMSDRLFIWDGQVWHPHTLPFGGWRWCRGIHRYKGELYGGGDSCRLFRWLGGSNWEVVGDLPVNPASEEIEAMATCYGRLFVSTSRPQVGLAPGLFVSAARPQGMLRSLIHEFAFTTRDARLTWDAFEPSGGTAVRFQVRWGGSPDEIRSRPFVGPDGTAASWFETPDTPLPEGHLGASCYQYIVEMRCPDGMQMPVVHSVTLSCDLLDPASVGSDRLPTAVTIRATSPVTDGARVWLQSEVRGEASPPAFDLRVFDARGGLVRVERVAAESGGRAHWRWDLRDDRGRRVPSGVYHLWAGIASSGASAVARQTVVVLR